MNLQEIQSKLNVVFQDVFDDDELVVTPDYSAEDVDGWDSLTHIRLVLTTEKAFGVKFSTSEVGQLETVGDLIKLIQSKVKA